MKLFFCEITVCKVYFVFLNNWQFITKSSYPRKLDYLKWGVGKLHFAILLCFPQSWTIYYKILTMASQLLKIYVCFCVAFSLSKIGDPANYFELHDTSYTPSPITPVHQNPPWQARTKIKSWGSKQIKNQLLRETK